MAVKLVYSETYLTKSYLFSVLMHLEIPNLF